MSSLDGPRCKSFTDEDDIPDEHRLFYDTVKINNQGRNKQEMDSNKGGTMGLLEEVVSWAITANAQQAKKYDGEYNNRDEEYRLRERSEKDAREVRKAKDNYDQYKYEYEKRKDR